MKRILSYVIVFFLGVSISVGASFIYNAKDIEYQNANADVTNVHDAINELYEIDNELNNLKTKGNASSDKILKGSNAVVQGELVNGTYEETKVYYLGTSNTYNIKELFPNIDYTKLNKENFIILPSDTVYLSINRWPTNIWSASLQIDGFRSYVYKPAIEYNNQTGVVSIDTKTYLYVFTAGGTTVTTSNGTYTPKVYLVYGNIETIN